MKRRSVRRAKKSQWRQLELWGGASAASVALVIVLAFMGAATTQRYALRSPEVAAVVSAILVDLANADRASQQIPALQVNPLLVAAAQAKANDMAAKGYFAHTSPDGVEPWHWFEEAGYTFEHAGENLAVDFSDSSDVERAWMNSPTHRENILDGKFTEIGIATAQGIYKGRLTTFVVQEFGSPAVRRSAVTAQTVPSEPAAMARASAQRPTDGESVARVASARLPSVQSAASSTRTAPELAASLARQDTGAVPLWGYAVGFPKRTLQFVYYILALSIVVGLAWVTRFEMQAHHVRHARAAGALIALMGLLFLVADHLILGQPVLALAGS